MKLTKIPLNKERIHATQNYVTNGHWLFRRDFFKRFLKTDNQQVNAAIDLKQNFTFDTEFTECTINDERCFELIKTPNDIPIHSFGLYQKDHKNLSKIFHTKTGKIITIAAHYIDPILSDLSCTISLFGKDAASIIHLCCAGELIGAIMPTRCDARASIIAAHQALQTKTGTQIEKVA